MQNDPATLPATPPVARPARFGTWTSPITADSIVADTVGLDQIAIDANDIYWIEGRASEQGRCVLVRHRDGRAADVLPAPWNVRTRVHEYGGGAYTVDAGLLVFTNLADQCTYRHDQDGGTAPQPLVTAGARRHADGVVDRIRNRIIAVCEDHGDGSTEPVNSIVAIALGQADAGGAVDPHTPLTLQTPQTLLHGSDFYASPRLSPDGSELAWLSWEHPDMPWDGTCLWRAAIAADGSLATPHLVAGGRRESIFQPAWSPSGQLHFVSDRSGWWNLYRVAPGAAGGVEALCPLAAEFGRAQWNFGVNTYGFDADGTLVCSYLQNGIWRLARIDAADGQLAPIALPFTGISDLKVGAGVAVFIGSAPDRPSGIVRLDLASGGWTILRRAVELELDPDYLSVPTAIEFPTSGERSAHAFYYAPRNREFTGLPGERAPLLVLSHGGPTSTASANLNLSIQFWTSRGFAVVDVNYGGSTGYGRAYRERLYGQWGIVDVDDAIAAARFLAARGDVDAHRMAIRGHSAGGFTTLAALTFHDYFKAGASYYGVSDLEALARDCHKFESRYLDHLVGPYPAARDVYRARSPIHFTERLAAPLILFQGLDDKVVPPNQSQAIFDALNEKGLPVAYLTFAGEQHGFRRAENIKHALRAELYFYGRVFGFGDPAQATEVEIMNLPENAVQGDQ